MSQTNLTECLVCYEPAVYFWKNKYGNLLKPRYCEKHYEEIVVPRNLFKNYTQIIRQEPLN